MNNEGKVKNSSILLSVLVIVAIVLIVFICFEYSKRNQNEKAVKEVVSQIESITPNEEKTELPYIEYEGYQIIGTIKIPKIDIEYPILVESTKDSLEKSITRVGNGKVNEVGNLSMAGHNYLDGTMFGKIDELQFKDGTAKTRTSFRRTPDVCRLRFPCCRAYHSACAESGGPCGHLLCY